MHDIPNQGWPAFRPPPPTESTENLPLFIDQTKTTLIFRFLNFTMRHRSGLLLISTARTEPFHIRTHYHN
jgi:hypothetical protein